MPSTSDLRPSPSRALRAGWALAILAGLAAAPATFGDAGRMDEIALGWVEAHNSADVEAMAAYRAAHRQGSGDGWREQFPGLVERLGRLEVVDVLVERAGQIVLGVESSTRGRMHLIFAFDASDREQISGIRLAGGPYRPNPLPELELAGDWPARQVAMDRFLTRLANEDVFSGAALVADGEQLRFAGAYGEASREFGVPNTLATRFDVGSITKDFTRVAIAQLIAAGKLGVDDKVGQHLPDYPNPEVREKVTVRHLFEHTSGVGDYFTEEWYRTPMGALRDHADYIAIWGPKPLQFEPGSRDEYSNFGFTILGAIIEAASEQSYFEYLREHVFEPAGMASTGFFATDEVVPDVAVGYTLERRDGERGPSLRKNIYLEPAMGGPWGKTYSTAEDLWRFWLALSRHRLTHAAYTPWVLLEAPPPAPGAAAESAEPVRDVGLGGGGPGLAADLEVVDDRIVIVLANQDPPISVQLVERLREALERAAD